MILLFAEAVKTDTQTICDLIWAITFMIFIYFCWVHPMNRKDRD